MQLPPYTTTTYQPALADFVKQHRLTRIVETGLGVSTVYLLGALDEMGEGHLTSIDPKPWYGGKIEGHPRWTWLRENSIRGLPQIDGPLDLFLHDSDHDILAQTFEYNFAWMRLRNGGWLATDDADWGQHGAWKQFCGERRLTPIKLGSVEAVQKIGDAVVPNVERIMGAARDAERVWLAKGGQNSAAFAEYRKGY